MKFRITCPVTRASGWQTWTVEADSKEDALAKHNAGKSDFEAEEVEVTSLGEPEIEEIS